MCGDLLFSIQAKIRLDWATRSIDVVSIPSFRATLSNELYYSVSPWPKRTNIIEYLSKLLKYVYVDHDFRTCGGS